MGTLPTTARRPSCVRRPVHRRQAGPCDATAEGGAGRVREKAELSGYSVLSKYREEQFEKRESNYWLVLVLFVGLPQTSKMDYPY